MKAIVIGASRGLGLEFVRQYRAQGWAVTATARGAEGLALLKALGAQAIELDVSSAESVSRLPWQVEGIGFDVAIYNAGVYGPRTNAMDAPGTDEFDAVMHTNVLGAMRVLGALQGSLAEGAKLAVISSRMGSIGARTSNSGWLYRASKAALNSVLADTAIALQGRAACVAFHPGWVRTDMGGAGADLTPEQSVASICRVIAHLQPEDNGHFFDHDGSSIPW
ncbi:MAG TPA: SDR family oxidoreductase [Burkholderiaceae bacterium]|jgi:NAD(P)-dependent dehydrogenase (short-subunit alcohol dehydrogenase family)|nr:SDR family oxidoreductase [Burkholderiaceae bacterium]